MKKCPFCGGAAKIVEHRTPYSVTYSVRCRECKAETWTYFIRREDAVKVWERRKTNDD